MSRGKHTPKQTGYAPEDGIAMPDDFDDMLAIALEKPNPGTKQAYIHPAVAPSRMWPLTLKPPSCI